jgi:hypothetical protein
MKENWKHIVEQHLAASRAGWIAARTQSSTHTNRGRRNLFLVCLFSSTTILTIKLYGAYEKRSSFDLVVAVLLWGVLAPFLAWWRFRRKARRTSS